MGLTLQRITIKIKLNPLVYSKILDRCLSEGLDVETAARMLLCRWMLGASVSDVMESMARRPEPKPAGDFPPSPGKADDSINPAGGLSGDDQ